MYLLYLLLQLQFLGEIQVEGRAHPARQQQDRCGGVGLWGGRVPQVCVVTVMIGGVLQGPPLLQSLILFPDRSPSLC